MDRVYDISGNVMEINFVTPEMYGAKADGITDDSAAIQSAVNQKGLILFAAGKTYKVTSTIRVPKDTVIDLNGSTILSTNKHIFYNFLEGDSYGAYNGNGNITIANGTIIGGCISFIHGYQITLRNIKFKNTLNDHYIEICACNGYEVDGCTFVGMTNITGATLEYINIDTNATYSAFPHNTTSRYDANFYDSTVNKNIRIINSTFALGTDTYAYGFNAIGVHGRGTTGTYNKDVWITDNNIIGFTGCGIRVNAMDNVYLANNKIDVAGDGIRIGDVADSKNIIIMDNYVKAGSGSSKIVRTQNQYTNLTVSGNVTEGDDQEF